MKNKGFTLPEILAVISILGVIAIFVIPTTLNVVNEIKKSAHEKTLETLKESTKMYLKDIEDDMIKFNYIDSDKNINGKVYKNGDQISGYDFKTYAIEKNGLTIPITELVSNKYFDEFCDYTNHSDKCKLKDTCKIGIKIDYELAENDKYYVTTGYDITGLIDCE